MCTVKSELIHLLLNKCRGNTIKYVSMSVSALNRRKSEMKTDINHKSFLLRTSGKSTEEVNSCNRSQAPLNTALLGRERWTVFVSTYTQHSKKRLHVRLLSYNVSMASKSQFSFTRRCEKSGLSSHRGDQMSFINYTAEEWQNFATRSDGTESWVT